MNIRVIVLLLTVAVSGCSPDDAHLPGYKAGSGDVTPFVLQSAISCGGRPVKTTGLPKVQGDWRYRADKDGVQIYLVGDYVSQVQTLLLAAFGPPSIAATTNQDGRVSGARYAGAAIGVAISYGRDDPSDGSPYAQIVIVKQGALKP